MRVRGMTVSLIACGLVLTLGNGFMGGGCSRPEPVKTRDSVKNADSGHFTSDDMGGDPAMTGDIGLNQSRLVSGASTQSPSTDSSADSMSESLYPVMSEPQPLRVPGFNDASFVTPSVVSNTARPVVIVLHGNFDRPEWQCDMWREVASWYGWVLCPRGVRTPWATLEEDRWTYRGGAKQVSKEMDAALTALENRFPGAIKREGAVLVGFSLGAILLPDIVQMHSGRFETVFIIEGGIRQMEGNLLNLKRHGVRRIGLAMSTPANRLKVPALQKRIKKMGISSVYVDMRGAGHNYRSDFGVSGNEALHRLFDGTPTSRFEMSPRK